MDLITAIEEVVGPRGLLLGSDVTARPNLAWGEGHCPAKAIVRPGSTGELAAVMRLCHDARQPVVPWGGLTGLVNGTTCQAGDIAISLERMTAIEHFDDEAGTITVQAGAPMQRVQETASEQNWLFAMDLGARGTATIGGNIATNAGGNSVVRYGMMREQVLGLEAVLADGTIVSSMNEVLKNNAGYDLKHLFIGTEGTLGIVTRAILRLYPAQRAVQTALVACDSFASVAGLLRRLGTDLEGKLSSFEVMWQSFYQLMVVESGKHQAFLPADYPYYVLVESAGADAQRQEEQFMSTLGTLMEEGIVANAVIAQSEQQTLQLWAMRDDIETLVTTLNPVAAFDISLPVRAMESYVNAVTRALPGIDPGLRSIVFGHLGDGNIHLVVGPTGDRHAVEALVYQTLQPLGGSISAEHGIGLEKKPYLSCSRSDVEIKLMQTLKSALDPQNILNPGKVIPDQPQISG
jgi:FAD/FMN-containing dehydrogenase